MRSRSENEVSATVLVSGCVAAILAIASMPSTRGIDRSMSTTSGRVSSTTASASSPSLAAPTTSMPAPVVAHGQRHVAVRARELEVDVAGVGVLEDVAQRLLGGAEAEVELRRAEVDVLADAHVDGDALPLQRRGEGDEHPRP